MLIPLVMSDWSHAMHYLFSAIKPWAVVEYMYALLNLFFLVATTISVEVLDQIQDEGDNASFTCQATGEPVPTISWYFNGALLADGATHTISETSVNITTINSTLTIMSVESSDVGTYTCINVVSSDISSGVLTVNGELRILVLH